MSIWRIQPAQERPSERQPFWSKSLLTMVLFKSDCFLNVHHVFGHSRIQARDRGSITKLTHWIRSHETNSRGWGQTRKFSIHPSPWFQSEPYRLNLILHKRILPRKMAELHHQSVLRGCTRSMFFGQRWRELRTREGKMASSLGEKRLRAAAAAAAVSASVIP